MGDVVSRLDFVDGEIDIGGKVGQPETLPKLGIGIVGIFIRWCFVLVN